MSEPLYVVCDRCGFFYGNMRLHENDTIDCPECGSDAAWAFAKIEKALDYQAHVRGAKT